MTVGPGSPFPRRILLVTDAWRPQTNGVVRALEATARNLEAMGIDMVVIRTGGSRWDAIWRHRGTA